MNKEKIYIPYLEKSVDMSPTDFEQFCIELIREQTRNIPDIKIEHNKCIKTTDGNYQIDGYIEFTIMGLKYKTIVECKMYKNSISRGIVQKLFDTLRATGSQKGILISTSNFQSGAMDYAANHGISLIQITEAPTENPMSNPMFRRIYLNKVVANISEWQLYNNGKPFIGVLVERDGAGTTCAYLKSHNDKLRKQILNINNQNEN